MALLTTITELRAALPSLFSRLSQNANLPNIGKAQRKHINGILGNDLVDDLETKYKNNGLSDDEKELLKLIQLPLAAYAVLDDMAFLHVIVADGGIFTAGTDKLQPAHRWEYLELKNTLQDYAIDGIEDLLAYLYDKKADFPLWADSPEFTELDSYIIKTGTDFSKYYTLYSPLYTFWALKPLLLDVEENYLAGTFGRDLLAWIKNHDKIEVTVPGGGLVDVKKLVKKAAAFLTIKHACEHFTPRLDKNGFTVVQTGNVDDNSNDGFTAATQQQVQQKKITCDKEGQNYLSKSAFYLLNVADGIYSADFDDSFTTAFEGSPLKKEPDAKPWTNGNERRKIFGL